MYIKTPVEMHNDFESQSWIQRESSRAPLSVDEAVLLKITVHFYSSTRDKV